MSQTTHTHRRAPRLLELRAVEGGLREFGCVDAEDLLYWIAMDDKRGKSYYPLGFLRAILGSNAHLAAESLVRLFALGRHKTARSRFEEMTRFGEWTASQPKALRLAGSADSGPSATWWQRRVDDWGGQVKATHTEKPRTAVVRIGNLNRCLSRLQRDKLFPLVDLPAIPRNAHKVFEPRPTLAEQVNRGTANRASLASVIEELVASFSPDDRDDARVEFNAMASMLGDLPLKTPEAMLEAFAKLQANCLSTVEGLASKAFSEWQAAYARGRELRRSANRRLARLIQGVLTGNPSVNRSPGRLVREHPHEDVVGSALLCFRMYNGGLAYSAWQPEVKVSAAEQFYRFLGVGRLEFDAMLHPTPHAVAAAMLLTACETGFNPAPLCEVDVELGIKPVPDTPGLFVCEALKRRAGNAFVNAALVAKRADGLVSSLTAIQAIKEAAKPLRRRLGTNKLFVFRFRSEPSFASGQFLAKRLRYLLRDADLDHKFSFTPSAIRPCFLALKQSSESPDSMALTHLSGHAEDSNAPASYEFRTAQRLRLAQYARQHHERLAQLADDAKSGKLSTAASDGSDEQHERSLTLIVEPTEEMFVDAFLTIECLERSNEELVNTRLQHWLRVCEPELAWARVVIEKAKQSELAHRVPAAKRAAERLISSGFTHFLE